MMFQCVRVTLVLFVFTPASSHGSGCEDEGRGHRSHFPYCELKVDYRYCIRMSKKERERDGEKEY